MDSKPGATVTVDPPVEPSQGPIYFNTMVMPYVSLSETSTDGGVTVVNVVE